MIVALYIRRFAETTTAGGEVVRDGTGARLVMGIRWISRIDDVV